MKIFILMRHGKACAYAENDFLRPLLPSGAEKVRQNAQKLAAHIQPEILLVSPLLRAQQTAQLVREPLGNIATQTREELDGRLQAAEFLEWIKPFFSKADSILCIGHNPYLGMAASLLAEQYIPMDTADWVAFDVTDEQNPSLLYRSNS